MCASRENKHHNQCEEAWNSDNSLTANHGYNISSIKYLNYSHRDDASNGRNVQNIVIELIEMSLVKVDSFRLSGSLNVCFTARWSSLTRVM